MILLAALRLIFLTGGVLALERRDGSANETVLSKTPTYAEGRFLVECAEV